MCASNEYESEAPTKTSNRECQLAGCCDAATHYVAKAATKTTPKTCARQKQKACKGYWVQPANVQNCDGKDEYLADYSCVPHKVCGASRFESKAPTDDADRECTDLTECVSGFFESQKPGKKSNRVCSPCHKECASTCSGPKAAPVAMADAQISSRTTCALRNVPMATLIMAMASALRLLLVKVQSAAVPKTASRSASTLEAA